LILNSLLSDDDILDKVGIGKRKLFIAPLDENSDNESASQPKPPTLPTESNENEVAVIPRDKGCKKKHKKSKHEIAVITVPQYVSFRVVSTVKT
jgi:hypothetical protein